MPQFPPVIELSGLDGNNGFKITGPAGGSKVGRALTSADVNGDGFVDLIVGAPFTSTARGTTYVVFGSANGFGANVVLSTLAAPAGYKITGVNTYDGASVSLSSAGDVNGDGIEDLLIGASGADPNGLESGAAYVVFGTAGTSQGTLNLGSLNGSNGFKLSGARGRELYGSGDQTGRSVSGGGDINGDGFDDIVIGAGFAEPNGISSGTSYVVFGSAGGFPPNFERADLNGSNGFKINGALNGDYAGFSVAIAGDINNDGFDDLLIGAHRANPGQEGACYVVFGKASGFGAELELSSLNGNNGFQINGEAPGDLSGCAVNSAGDINGDGFADIIIGAYGADPNGSASGAAYVIFGKSGSFGTTLELSSLNGTNGFQVSGTVGGDSVGQAVAAAGDVNGDGFDDILVSAYYASPNGNQSGASYVVFGRASGFASNLQLSALDGSNGFKINGVAAGDYAGFALSKAGDLNGDGFADIMVGAPEANGGRGNAYVIYGRLPDAAVNRTGTAADQTLAGGNFNDRLSGLAGDDQLYGNGGNDVINGGTGFDRILAGAGNDSVTGGRQGDILDGGAGVDTLNYAASITGVSVNLQTGTASGGDATGDVISGFERTIGSSLNDTLTGSNLANILTGGLGGDSLAGGLGKDVFDFNSIAESTIALAGRDTITDFNANAQDRIDLRTIDAIAGGADNIFSFVGSAAFTALGQVRFFQSGGNTFVDVNTTGTTAPDMRIQLTGFTPLTRLISSSDPRLTRAWTSTISPPSTGLSGLVFACP